MYVDPIKDSDGDSFPPAPVYLNVVATTGPTYTTTSTATVKPLTPTISLSMFCHFCLDSCSTPCQHQCIKCGATICKQFITHDSSFIFINTVKVKKKYFSFLCASGLQKGRRSDSWAICSLEDKGEDDLAHGHHQSQSQVHEGQLSYQHYYS